MIELSDEHIRIAAFDHVKRLVEVHGTITSQHLSEGFRYSGDRVPLVNPQRGIFKPRVMEKLLSIRTVFPRPGARVWYDDQRNVHSQLFESQETVEYAFMGSNPQAAENRWLREAYEDQIPFIYFLGVSPGRYQVIMPVFVANWNRASLKADIAFGRETDISYEAPSDATERRYSLREVQQRLHQTTFREAVMTAYNGRCAITGLPEARLIDAAHIVSDGNEKLGQPVVPNGLPLSKTHHAAFDSQLLGIDPDYRVHISQQLLAENDGPLLESIKGLHGGKIQLPRRDADYPDRDRLAFRFERFLAAS